MVAARQNTDIDFQGCATMGEKLVVQPGQDVVVAIAIRDPQGKSYSPYSFPNPSLLQVGIVQPLDEPVLHHVDVIGGKVTGFRKPGAADYAGAWPDNWVNPYANETAAQILPSLDGVPAAARNETARVIKMFGEGTWRERPSDPGLKTMSFRLRAVSDSQYVRLRGTNLPPAVPFETDTSGNPLPDVWTNSGAVQFKNSSAVEFADGSLLRIPCTTVGQNVPANGELYTGVGQPKIDGCPSHLPVRDGVKYVAFDVAAWTDLWVYSNPIFVEVERSTLVAGVR
jgi:hypothetical protein